MDVAEGDLKKLEDTFNSHKKDLDAIRFKHESRLKELEEVR